MVELLVPAGRLLLALALVALNGFFVASEFAFVRIRATTVDRLREEGRAGSGALSDAVDQLDDYLAVTQLGITLASLGLGWAGEPAVAALIEQILAGLVSERLLHLLAFAIGFSVITFLHVVFGELAPKTIAIQRAERIALLVAPPMKLFYYVFLPGIVVFNGTANQVTKLVGVSPASETEETLQEEELRRVLARSGQAGHVDAEEIEMIESVFELDDTSVREVMVPRPDVVTVSPELSLPDLRDVILEAGHTRYPVVDESDDDVVGFVDAKDVLRAIGGGTDAATAGDDSATADRAADRNEPATADRAAAGDELVSAGDIAREMLLVPETVRLDQLLSQLQAHESQMAAVIDEWGAFEGVATVEDVLEAVVGDLRDDFDVEEGGPAVERRADGTAVVDGGVSITEINDVLGTSFEAEGVDTIAGLVLDRLGEAPDPGDEVAVDDVVLTVDRVDGARIDTVLVRQSERDDTDRSPPDGRE